MSTTIITLSLLLIIFFVTPQPTSSQSCQRFCGQIPLKYPFGSAPGCGDPRFQPYLTCDTSNQALAFHTKKASYPITSIDYPTRTIYISDPSMSTCRDGPTCQPSRGFALDWDAPFSFHDETLFALLGCSSKDSPLLSNATVKARLCDQRALPICSFLSSCRAIAATVTASDDNDDNALESACCVYAPVDLGPAFEMDLEKLRCRSYSGFYGFRGRQSDPESWKYGVALEYKFGVYDEFPSYCDKCEKSFGVCGYVGEYNSFVCNCPSGLNTTSDCLFGYSSHGGSKLLLPWNSLLGMLLLFIGLYFQGF